MMPTDMDLKIIFNEFLDELSGQSESTRYNYTRRLAPFLETNKKKTLVQITRADINAFIAQITARGYAEATLSGYRQALKSYFNYCVRKGYLPRSPADHVKTGKFTSQRRKLPPEPDVEKITQLAEQWLQTNQPRKVRDAIIWLICVRSGPRQREIGELRKSEVEYTLRMGPDAHGIYRCLSRGKTKEVLIRFDEQIARGLIKWLKLRPQSQIDRCFITIRKSTTKDDPVPRHRSLSRSATTHILDDLATYAGISKAVFSHALRHRRGTKTTQEHDAKIAAMILNHKDWQSAKTAIEFYYHPQEENVSAVLAAEQRTGREDLSDWDRFFGVKRNETG